MKLEKLVGERFKERPADCVIDSHAIMVKGGYIKYMANGNLFFLSAAASHCAQNRADPARGDGQNRRPGSAVPGCHAGFSWMSPAVTIASAMSCCASPTATMPKWYSA